MVVYTTIMLETDLTHKSSLLKRLQLVKTPLLLILLKLTSFALSLRSDYLFSLLDVFNDMNDKQC